MKYTSNRDRAKATLMRGKIYKKSMALNYSRTRSIAKHQQGAVLWRLFLKKVRHHNL